MSYEVDLAIEFCEAPWDLALEEGEIVSGSYLGSWKEYIKSFYSTDHEAALKERLIRVLEEEEDIIAIEKVGAIANRNASSWFRGIDIANPVELLCIREGIQTFPGQITPVVEWGTYRNYPGENILWQFLETQRLLFVGARSAVTYLGDLEDAFVEDPEILPRYLGEEPRVTWIGHATLLIQVGGVNIITDPSFGFVFPCFKRHVPPGISLDEFPLVDLVLNSHNHGDHTNQIEHFARYQPHIFAGANTRSWLEGKGFKRVHEHDWWESTLVKTESAEIKITAVPAQHGSQTTLFNANAMLWCGYVIEAGGKTLYFAGDTAMGEQMVDKEGNQRSLFEQIKERFGPIDIAFLPIAPEGEPGTHIDHKEALQAFQILNAQEIVPIHWGAYRTGKERIEEPIEAFMLEAENLGLLNQVRMLKIGESFICGKDEKSGWLREGMEGE